MKNWVKILISVVLLVPVILCICFYSNRADIYAKLGDYYTKKDNSTAAQSYYKKAYSLGYQNPKFRENYVNLLINSPLTLQAQEQLVEIAEDANRDIASESARYFLYNLKREIHNKYPNNYIQQAPYNQKIIHWGKIPITYSIKQTKNVPPEIVAAVNDAFDSWERASSARIRFERVNVNPDIAVSFTDYTIKMPKPGEKYVIAYTLPETSSNKLNKMDMVLNLTNIDGGKFTPNQIYNTALHEVFHALGFMGHSFEKENIMYMAQSGEVLVNDERRQLSDADKLTLELFYKIRPDITNASDIHYEYIPYPVIGDNAEVNYAKADEAKRYISKAPRVPAGYIDLAQAQINQKDFEGATENLKRAYALSQNDETRYLSLYNLAITSYLDKDYESAKNYVKRAMKLKNEDDLHVLLAEIYRSKNDNNGVINEYTYLISKNPDNLEYTVNLVNMYITKRSYLKARKVLKNYIKRNPHQKANPRFKPCKILLL